MLSSYLLTPWNFQVRSLLGITCIEIKRSCPQGYGKFGFMIINEVTKVIKIFSSYPINFLLFHMLNQKKNVLLALISKNDHWSIWQHHTKIPQILAQRITFGDFR